MRILAICGSLQAASSNLALLTEAIALAPEGVEIVLYDGLRHLPHFNPDLEDESGTSAPASVVELRAELSRADALLIASPEYGFSLPGALKNAIDWAIGSGELEGKTVAVTASVNVAERGRRGLGALSDTLAAVRANVTHREPIVRGPTAKGELVALIAALVDAATAARVSRT